MVSEKFEAMVKLGLLNSRMKDFYMESSQSMEMRCKKGIKYIEPILAIYCIPNVRHLSLQAHQSIHLVQKMD